MSKLITVGGHTFKLIGDPHIGRKFKTGVPLHRLGERETLVKNQFYIEVASTDNIPIIIMGDLFDTYSIPDELTLWVSETLNEAVQWKEIYVLRGNHCVSREVEKRGSFDVLERLCPAVVFVKQVYEVVLLKNSAGRIALFGYDAFKSAAELAETLTPDLNYLAAFGHYDLNPHGSDFNVVPTEVFSRFNINTVYTGHIHKAQTIERHGVTVHAVGSLQPYAHGEELEGETLYQTLHKNEVEDLLAQNENHFEDVNLRVLVASGGSWVEAVPNCLSFQVKILAADDSDLSDLEVGYEEFSTTNILNKNLVGVSENLTALIHQRIEHYKSLEN